MYHTSYGHLSGKGNSWEYQSSCYTPREESSSNPFTYIKKHINETSSHNCLNGSQKVLVNPHFKANKVFVNPKFSGAQPTTRTIHVNPLVRNVNVSLLSDKQRVNSQPNQRSVPLQSTKIHINPNAKSVHIPLNIPPQTLSQTVHINPKFKNISNTNILSDFHLKNVPSVLSDASSVSHMKRKENLPSVLVKNPIILTKTKLIRTPVLNNKKLVKRRNSVKSKYKIVKSHISPSKKNNISLEKGNENLSKDRYKIDNRRRKSLSIIAKNHKKYIYINRFLSTSDLVKNKLIKSSPGTPYKTTNIVNINGVVYRKSRNSIRRASVTNNSSLKKSPSKTVLLSKYKLVKKSPVKKQISQTAIIKNKMNVQENNMVYKKFKIIRKTSPKKTKAAKVSPVKLKKCNIPCPYYKKYGFCKGKENGKCFRKHDPDQIALCTRFLQGACIKENCLLSHNVSPEKMPTCKYYLEGSCSKENCPYLHVKINPKAEVCRDFLEGFCKKAVECDKRHQYLCPDYEKYGNCLKQRCPYPHGKMVRNYLQNKAKFVKKCSDAEKKLTKSSKKLPTSVKNCESIERKVCKNDQVKENQRYYDENKSEEISSESKSSSSSENKLETLENNEKTGKTATKTFVGLQTRPKLGSLPAFIPFDKS